jgi:hypothetical protein
MEDRTLLATFAVTNASDSGPGSLGPAVIDANTVPALTDAINSAIPGAAAGTIGTSADFNRDGKLDLATYDSGTGDVSILLGSGDGNFQTARTFPAVPFVNEFGSNVSMVAGDFNGDGRIDLAIAGYDSQQGAGEVAVLLGNGDGTFQPPVTYPAGVNPYSIVAGDFTGLGRLDLGVVGSGDQATGGSDPGGMSVLLGNGDGTFRPAVYYPVGQNPKFIVAGDFTGNGALDLAVIDSSDTVTVLRGTGDGTFRAAASYSVASIANSSHSPEVKSFVTADFTGDGKLDLIVSSTLADPGTPLGLVNTISILMGNGDGTFQRAQTLFQPQDLNSRDLGFGPLVAGDFNRDGKTDVAFDNPVTNHFVVLLGNSSGTVQSVWTSAVAGNFQGLVAGDFGGDGNLDPALFSGPSSATVLDNSGNGTFTSASQLAVSPQATPLVVDVNGDGALDVLIVDASGNILYRQGIPGQPGSFEPPVTINPSLADGSNPYASRDIAWLSDTDQGSILASVDSSEDAIFFYAYRDGGFVQLNGSLTTGEFPAQIIAADLSGGGFTDLVVRNAADGTLSVFFGSVFNRSNFNGPPNPRLAPPSFLAPMTLSVGLGVSDIQAVDTSGSGRLDLVATNKLTGQVSVFLNLGDRAFAAPITYRAGTGLSEIEPGSTPESTSLDATAGVAAGPFTADNLTDLVTINPGSNSLDVLAGLGGGRFANPVQIGTPSPARVVRTADLTGSGAADLVLLTVGGVTVDLGNGKGGFSAPVTYNAGTDPTGVTVADILGNGKLDVLVGNDFGDVLILVGNGDGTFRPFEPVQDAIALAVADLTGNGVPDFVFANQSLNHVTVVYGNSSQSAASPTVVGDQATGVLAPGALVLTDMNGDGFPDLVVANSGGNNILVYPGLGNGQFGPPIDGTTGFHVGTDPTGLTVADLNGQPDLLVADTGSNDVSVLLGQGSGSSWTMIPGPRIRTGAGPVATVVGDILAKNQSGLAVANYGADDVQVFPSVGGGFFNDEAPATETVPVGRAPSGLFLGDFSGSQGLATLNAGSNDGTLITALGSGRPQLQTFRTGGDRPTIGFVGDFFGNGFTDLVVGDNGDGSLALLVGGTGGLSLFETVSSALAPSPTGLSFGAVSGGSLSFFVSTAGREAAIGLSFHLKGGREAETGVNLASVTSTHGSAAGVLSQATSGSVQHVSLLLSLSGTTLDLAATLLTVSLVDIESSSSKSETTSSTGPGKGQGSNQAIGNPGDLEDEPSENAGEDDLAAQAAIDEAPAWKRLAIGLARSWERARAAILELDGRLPAAAGRDSTAPSPIDQQPEPPVRAPAQPTSKDHSGARATPAAPPEAATAAPFFQEETSSIWPQDDTGRAVDASLAGLGTDREADCAVIHSGLGSWNGLAAAQHPDLTRGLVTTVAAAAMAGAGRTLGERWARRRRSRNERAWPAVRSW